MTDSTDNARGPKRITHPYKGPDLPTEVFADPGRHDWYFREKMPDSVARFVRADLAPDPLGAVKVKPLEWDDSGAAWVAWDDVKEYVVYAENRKEAERIDNERAARIRSALEHCDQLANPHVVVEQAFMAAVWDALKSDANDLRKQKRILSAFRTALSPTGGNADG